VPQVAAFDTAFHHTIPDAAALYPLPRDWTDRYKLRRYGFHGLSVSYAVRRCSELLGALPRKLVVCHLGAGCSVTAVADGRSVDTSMGFTPLEGMMMATRSGSIDPGLLLYLLNRQGMEAQALDTALNQRSGVLGVSGISADFRTVQEQVVAGSAAARLAYDMFVHSLVRTIGAMAGVLGGLDALVFTGGIGEHSATVRADVTAVLAYLGVAVDARANKGRSDDTDIAARGARVRVPVITAREDLTILADVRRLLG
jgi:acetate kinase